MQDFLHGARFNHARMRKIYKNELSSRVVNPARVLSCDSSEFVKKGKHDDSVPWERVFLGEGSQGPIIAEVKVLRVFECRDGLPKDEVWLYIRRFADGKLKFSLSNAPANIKRVELHRAATLRWPIEQCFEECKSFLGMGHCEARSWNAWRLHILFILIAHLFILGVRQHFKKTGESVLTLPLAQKLIIAGLSGDKETVKKALKIVNYHMKRNMAAYRSHRKTRLPMLNDAVL